MPFVGIGVGIGRQRFGGGIFAAYAARVAADGGVTEAGACVNAVSGISLNSSLLLVPSGYKSGVVYSQIPTDGDGDLTFARASDATRVNSDGEIEVVGSGVPRLDYSQGSCPALLLEPQRTNLALYSEEFDDAAWTKSSATITANVAVSPDGYTNADKFIPNTSNTTHLINQTGFASNAYTFSVFAKADGETTFSMWLLNNTVRAQFDLSNGTILISTVTSSKIEDYGNGWYRCSVYSSTAGTTAAIYGRTGGSFIGNDSDGILLWGAQLEQGAYATSYIPTTSATVTRLADVCSKTGISSLIGQTEGTLFVEFNHDISVTASLDSRIQLSDGTTSNWIFMGIPDGGTKLLRMYVNSSSGTLSFFSSSSVIQGVNKAAFGYKSGDFVAYLNGTQVATNTTSHIIPPCSRIDLQGGGPGVVSAERENINQALLFKTRLSNTELAQLTTI